jgi:hypothetical protein
VGCKPTRRRLGTVEALFVPPDEVLCVGKGFGFNHKIMINVWESPPRYYGH